MDFESEDQHIGDSAAIEGIENLVLSFLNQLVEANSPPNPNEVLKAHQRRAKSKIQLQLVNRAKGSSKTLTFPRKCATGSARPLAQLFRILDLAHEAIIEDMPITKRDMFYNDVQLFKSQKTVDTLVDDLAATFNVDRSSLNIRASSKGLICGSGLTIYLTSGERIQPTDTEGTLIPVGEDIESFGLEKDVCWVLIIEKDAVFQTLCRLRVTNHSEMPGRGLLITGKGYPDIATRHLVKTLADCLPPRIPIMSLVDADPYGLDILSVYNYGSRALRHEDGRLAANGKIKWLGICSSELSGLGVDKDKLLPISKTDEKKAFAMLARPKEVLPPKWKKELMHMLFYRRKAEIEILSTLGTSDGGINLNLEHNHSNKNALDTRSLASTADMSLAAEAMQVEDVDRVKEEASEVRKRECQDRLGSHEAPTSVLASEGDRIHQCGLRNGLFQYVRWKVTEEVGECDEEDIIEIDDMNL